MLEENLLERFGHYFHENYLTDLKIIGLKSVVSSPSTAGENNNQVLAHRLVLSSLSLFLRQLFIVDDHDHYSDADASTTLILPDFSILEIKKVVGHFYNSRKNTNNSRNRNEVELEEEQEELLSSQELELIKCLFPRQSIDFSGYQHQLKNPNIQCSNVKNKKKKVSSSSSSNIKKKSTHYKCRSCPSIFKYPSLLKEHEGRMHASSYKFYCENCDFKCNIERDLKRHREIHEGIRNHLCNYCGRTFRDKRNWKVHVDKHQGIVEKKFTCHVCNKTFARKDTLVNHLRFHTGDKPFKCDFCGLQFSLHSTLLYHKKTHGEILKTKNSTNTCQFCDKVFKTLHQLQKHLLIHTQTQIFTCTLCRVDFHEYDEFHSHTSDCSIATKIVDPRQLSQLFGEIDDGASSTNNSIKDSHFES